MKSDEAGANPSVRHLVNNLDKILSMGHWLFFFVCGFGLLAWYFQKIVVTS